MWPRILKPARRSCWFDYLLNGARSGFLYVTKNREGAWDARMQKLPTVYGHVTLYYGLGAMPQEILTRLQTGEETIVVLDTILIFWGCSDETNNSEVTRALIPYIAASRTKNQTLIAVHHDRKGGGDHGEGIAGGHAFLGAVDIAIELKRDGHEDSVRRLLRGWGTSVRGSTADLRAP